MFQPKDKSVILKERPGVKYYSLITKDCTGWYKLGKRQNGVYQIIKYKRSVFCNMKEDGGGWIVFQKRFDGNVNFFDRTWDEYREGFGNLSGEY